MIFFIKRVLAIQNNSLSCFLTLLFFENKVKRLHETQAKRFFEEKKSLLLVKKIDTRYMDGWQKSINIRRCRG